MKKTNYRPMDRDDYGRVYYYHGDDVDARLGSRSAWVSRGYRVMGGASTRPVGFVCRHGEKSRKYRRVRYALYNKRQVTTINGKMARARREVYDASLVGPLVHEEKSK